MARPKGISELESSVIRKMSISLITRLLEKYEKDFDSADPELLAKICMPVVLKTLPDKIEIEDISALTFEQRMALITAVKAVTNAGYLPPIS